MSVVRGILSALVVVLLVASGVWAGPVSAAAGLAPGTPDETGDGSGAVATVTTPTPNESVTNTTDSNDSTVTSNTTDDVATTTNSTDTTDSANTTDATDDATTVTVNGSVEGETANVSISAETGTNDGLTAGLTANGSVSGASVETAVDLQGSSATDESTRASGTGTEPSTPTETSGKNASAGDAKDGAPGSGSDGDVPATAAGAVLVGFGAAAVTLLARRSATVVAFAPDVVTTVSRLPSPLAQHWSRMREWLPRVLAAVGYSRYDDSDPLTHATRAELYELIAESPGTYLSELSEQADVPTSTVRHHLDVLVREGVVTTANVRGKRRYFSLDAGDETLAAALSDDASAAVIECLADDGPASVSAIAEALDRDVSTVSHHLGRLAEDDLVEREREGRSVYNDLSPEVEEALGGESSGRQPGRA